MHFSSTDFRSQQRLNRGAEHLTKLGPRATAEFLTELGNRIGGAPAIMALLVEYERLTPGMVRAAGGDRFPPKPVRAVERRA